MMNCRTRRVALVVVGVAVFGVGCRAGGKGARGVKGVKGPPKANRMRSGHAPTPFSADEIRRSCTPGSWRKYLIEIPGRPSTYRILRFTGGTKHGTEVSSTMTDLEGKPFGEERRLRASWKALQSHASFPTGRTTVHAESYRTPAGTFDCWRYDVTGRSGGQRELKRFWFAKTLPGSPIAFERFLGGKRVFRMILVQPKQPKPAKPQAVKPQAAKA